MRQPTFAHWSNQVSPVHRLDARIKLFLLIAFVVSLALLRSPSAVQLAASLAALLAVASAAGLPLWRLLRTSLLVLPFVGVFSIIVYLSGDLARASLILLKSYLSAFAVLVAVSSTPLPHLLSAARFFRVPALLVEITQLIYRYIFVLSAEAHTMRTAFLARRGRSGRRALLASSGIVAVLFSRSYEKAAVIHHAMCARGFSGNFRAVTFPALTRNQAAILAAGLVFTVALHLL